MGVEDANDGLMPIDGDDTVAGAGSANDTLVGRVVGCVAPVSGVEHSGSGDGNEERELSAVGLSTAGDDEYASLARTPRPPYDADPDAVREWPGEDCPIGEGEEEECGEGALDVERLRRFSALSLIVRRAEVMVSSSSRLSSREWRPRPLEKPEDGGTGEGRERTTPGEVGEEEEGGTARAGVERKEGMGGGGGGLDGGGGGAESAARMGDGRAAAVARGRVRWMTTAPRVWGAKGEAREPEAEHDGCTATAVLIAGRGSGVMYDEDAGATRRLVTIRTAADRPTVEAVAAAEVVEDDGSAERAREPKPRMTVSDGDAGRGLVVERGDELPGDDDDGGVWARREREGGVRVSRGERCEALPAEERRRVPRAKDMVRQAWWRRKGRCRISVGRERT